MIHTPPKVLKQILKLPFNLKLHLRCFPSFYWHNICQNPRYQRCYHGKKAKKPQRHGWKKLHLNLCGWLRICFTETCTYATMRNNMMYLDDWIKIIVDIELYVYGEILYVMFHQVEKTSANAKYSWHSEASSSRTHFMEFDQKKWFPSVERMRTHPNQMDRSQFHLQAKAGSERCLANWNTFRCSCSQKSPRKGNPWRMETFPFQDFEASSRKKWCLLSTWLVPTLIVQLLAYVNLCQGWSTSLSFPIQMPGVNTSDNSCLNTEAFIHSYHFMLKDLRHWKYGHGVLNKWKLKGCSTLTFCVFILRWAHIWHICCFIHFHSLHTKKITWHVINIYTEISMNGHLEGNIWTSINIPTYPFHPTHNFKLDLFCVGFICRILNSAEYIQKVIAGERWMCGLNSEYMFIIDTIFLNQSNTTSANTHCQLWYALVNQP